ncbi:hypothetical protein QVN85_12260 [Oscillibacter valericigenes]|nr:hypothetical protein [Oscillibacter valericigenes]
MKTIKKLALTIVTYGGIILLATVIFIALFHTPLFRSIGVFFYRGCILLVISSVIAAALTVMASKLFRKLEMDAKDAMVVFFLFSGFTLGWYTLIPVTVERSISVFMLSYMDQNDTQGISSDEFGDVFYGTYIQDFGAFDKRFREQVISGNIEDADDGGYVITDSGRTVVNLFRTCANLFDTEKWLVYPNDYTAGERK